MSVKADGLRGTGITVDRAFEQAEAKLQKEGPIQRTFDTDSVADEFALPQGEPQGGVAAAIGKFAGSVSAYFDRTPPAAITPDYIAELRKVHSDAALLSTDVTTQVGSTLLVCTPKVRRGVEALLKLEAGIEALKGTELEGLIPHDYVQQLRDRWEGPARNDFRSLVSEMKNAWIRAWTGAGAGDGHFQGALGHAILREAHTKNLLRSTEEILLEMADAGGPVVNGHIESLLSAMKNLKTEDGRANAPEFRKAAAEIEWLTQQDQPEGSISATVIDALAKWLGPSTAIIDAYPGLSFAWPTEDSKA